MLPLNLFFLWLALQMKLGVQQVAMKMADNFSAGNASVGAVFTGTTSLSAVMGSLIAVAFIILGMKLSHKLGISAADGGVKMAQNAGGWIKDKGTEYSKRGAAKAYVRSGAAEGVQTRLTKAGETGWGRALGIGKLAQRHELSRIGVEKKAATYTDEKTKQYEEIFKARGAKGIEALLGTATGQERAAMLALLGSKDKLGPDSEAVKRFGEEQILNSVDVLERDGQTKRADAIRIGFGKDRDIYNGERAITRNASEISELQGSFDRGEIPSADDFNQEMSKRKSTLDESKKRLEDATAKFNKRYSKPNEQDKINKNIFSQDDKDIDEGQRIRRYYQADFINADKTGGRFFGAMKGAGGSQEKIVTLLRSLVKSATKQQDISANMNSAFQSALNAGFNPKSKETRDFKVTMVNESPAGNKLTEADVNRIIKQFGRSVGGDLGVKQFGEEDKKPETGGGDGEKGKSK